MIDRVLSLHVNLGDRGLNLPSYLKERVEERGAIISVCPASIIRKQLSKEEIEKIQDLLTGKCILGQGGFKGRCRYLHRDGSDPGHENVCLDLRNSSLTSEEQTYFMSEGMGILEDTFKINVEVYKPPGHFYDDYTVAVAEVLGYRFMMDRNIIGIHPYKREGQGHVIIVPEAKIGDKAVSDSAVIYAHASELRETSIRKFLLERVNIVSPSEIKAKKAPSERDLGKNGAMKLAGKIHSDWGS